LQFVFDEMKTEEGNPINRFYPKDSFDLFAGEQIVIVGRYKKPGVAKVIVEGIVDGAKQKLDFPATLIEKSSDESFSFIEKLWAVRRVGEILDEIDLKGKNDELVKELVDLATRHGILTPYTSFMADENSNIHDFAANVPKAAGRLHSLGMSFGSGGFAQRSMKGKFQNEAQAPSASSPSESLKKFDYDKAADAFGAPEAEVAGREAKSAEKNMRNVGDRTFFRREGRWVDSKVTKDQETNAKRVKQFSDEYFKLAETHGKKLSQYLIFDEPVLLYLDDQAYLIEP
jgi:Ca-activated chloride channel family protein